MNGLSDLDGETPTNLECKVCKLSVPDYLYSGFYCKAYSNFAIIQTIKRFNQQLIYFAAIFVVFSLFTPAFRAYNIPILIVAFIPMILISQFSMKIHYKGFPPKMRIIHQLRMYTMRRDLKYYFSALNITRDLKDELSELHKNRILLEIVDSVLLSPTFNPINLIENWASALTMEENEFVDQLFEKTDIINGFQPLGGAGIIPDIFPLITKSEIRKEAIEAIAKGCELLDEATDIEKRYFQQDIFLIFDEIEKEVEMNKKWSIIQEVYESYTPEDVPKSTFEALQKRMVEIQRQQMLTQRNLDDEN